MNEKGEAAPIGEGRLCCKHCTLKFTKQEVFQEVKKIISLAWPTVSDNYVIVLITFD